MKTCVNLFIVTTLSLIINLTAAVAQENRIIVFGAAPGEVASLLGMESDLVGVGRLTTYPKNLQKDFPIVAYVRRAPAEGILALNPTHVLAPSFMGPEQTIEILEADENIKFFQTKEVINPEDVATNIRLVGGFFGKFEQANKIALQVEKDFDAVKAAAEDLPEITYAITYYSKGKLFVSGSGSTNISMGWAKGVNVFDGVPRRTEANRESLLAKDPDVILLFSFSLERMKEDGKSMADFPALSQTSAWKNNRVSVLPRFVYAMGPRTPQAINTMIGNLHGKDKMANLPPRDYAPQESLVIKKG